MKLSRWWASEATMNATAHDKREFVSNSKALVDLERKPRARMTNTAKAWDRKDTRERRFLIHTQTFHLKFSEQFVSLTDANSCCSDRIDWMEIWLFRVHCWLLFHCASMHIEWGAKRNERNRLKRHKTKSWAKFISALFQSMFGRISGEMRKKFFAIVNKRDEIVLTWSRLYCAVEWKIYEEAKDEICAKNRDNSSSERMKSFLANKKFFDFFEHEFMWNWMEIFHRWDVKRVDFRIFAS